MGETMNRLFFTLIIFAAVTLCAKESAVPLEKMIGQTIVIGFEGERISDEGAKRVRDQIRSGAIGGAVIYGRNIKSPAQLEEFMRTLHYANENNPPLWIMIDQEGGRIQRLNSQKGFSDYPTAKKIGEGTQQNAYATYRNLACELRGYGINFNLAPVVDLDFDRNDSVISIDKRSFGSDPIKVAKFAEEFIKAHNSCGILTALKHFPGHGSARLDPHVDTADATGFYDANESIPFERLIATGKARAIMVAHILDRDFDGFPATLSKKRIDSLRALGFDGVVISDDLQMGAVSNIFDLNQTVISAFNAGNDVLLFANMLSNDPDIPQKVVAIVKEAIKNGLIDEKAIVKSYERIIALKNKRL
jgi:beta-N-acetylhexosaminidase